MIRFSFSTYKVLLLTAVALTAILTAGCRNDEEVVNPEEIQVGRPVYSSISGFYLLNEGNMGSNKCTLDFYDYTSGVYTRNIYGSINPSVPKELGDVGNDMAVYGSRLYAVINCSNKVEVMEAATCRRIGQIDIPNCRSLAFDGKDLYVTSYAGPVVIDPEYSQRGFVARVDTATLSVIDRCIVGYQPDGIAIAGDYIYVANSGGYRVPNYERTMTVIDRHSFSVTDNVDIAVNLEHIVTDRRGRLWISSRGDYYDIPGRLFCYDPSHGRVVRSLDVNAGGVWLDGDSLYTVGNAWSYETMSNVNTFAIINTATMEKVTDSFISDPSGASMSRPYGIAVNPLTKDVFVTDARTYVTPGYLYCYAADGSLKWSVRTGDIPACITFLGKK